MILDLWEVDQDILDNLSYLHTLGKIAIAKSGASFVSMTEKKFSPHGVTILFLLEESHLSFHSFWDQSYLAVDIYTCGDTDPNIAADYIVQELRPKKIYRQEIIRGVRY